MLKETPITEKYDVICVGGGIMSATLSLMLKLLDPSLKIVIFERLGAVAEESSAAWNNAGTGHSALCELNYTPIDSNGEINISKAEDIYNQFHRSKQFWSFLSENGMLKKPGNFIRPVPHHSWVTGKDNVDFLKRRFKKLENNELFSDMVFTEDQELMKEWFPLIMNDRSSDEIMAATRTEQGTELNFGYITKKYIEILQNEFDVPVLLEHEVRDVDPDSPDDWLVEVENLKTGKVSFYDADHVFIGAGGGALPLLQKVEIPEKEGYGGFPVSGQWLYCMNEDLIEQHHAKVYSKAGPDAPPMSTPHLDSRYIDGKKELLFGPFAGFTSKFLKEGSILDLPKSIRFDNIPSMWGVFWHNLPLTEYLIKQVTMDHEDRMKDLRVFIKNANADEWELKVAGQRVQIIKQDDDEGGILEFGTDVVHSKDGTITALLGASPGASTAVHIMLEVIAKAYPEKLGTVEWQEKLNEMIPFWNRNLLENIEEYRDLDKRITANLNLENKKAPQV